MSVTGTLSRAQRFAALLLLVLLAGLLLKLAQAVLIPIVLAGLLAFLLNPVVTRLHRWGVPRGLAVILVVSIAFLIVTAIAIVVSNQVASFANELPRHSRNIEEKVVALKRMTRGETLHRLSDLAERIDTRTDRQADAEAPRLGSTSAAGNPAKSIRDDSLLTLAGGRVGASVPGSLLGVPLLSTFLDVLGTAGIVAVLAIFFLIYQVDIRDRVVSVAGRGALATTTKALEEAGSKISRYLLMQFVVNASYGLVAGIGLWLLGVPYAVMWGLIAGCLRYIPYVGPWVAAILPIAVSLATARGWMQPLSVIGMFVVMELLSNNVMEPLVYGRSVGLSEVAVILSAVVWAWLWGAVGLVLATPMTVCLVVLGKYVPGLRIFDQLLGEPPPVGASVRLYQRLLARDNVEADEMVRGYLEEHTPLETCDDLLIPALDHANQDLRSGTIDEDDAQRIDAEVQELIEEQLPFDEPAIADRKESTATVPTVIAMTVRSQAERLVLEMLDRILAAGDGRIEILSPEMLLSERLQATVNAQPIAVCLSVCQSSDLMHVRRLCKRIRHELPDVQLLVGLWAAADEPVRDRQLMDAGANYVVVTLAAMQKRVQSLIQLHGSLAKMPSNTPIGGDS